jgi:hypothetical protein
MDSGLLSRTRAGYIRLRWRRLGAWMWPAFAAFTIVDGVVGHLLPPAGATETLVAGALLGMVANLIAVVLLARPVGWLFRLGRRDLPNVVARDYAGTLVIVVVSAVLLTVGLVHRPMVIARQRAVDDAIVRAQAYIGDRAPAEFRRNLQFVSMLAIQPGTIYRACVRSIDGEHSYCVIVNRNLPFGRSVTFSGYEPNSVLAAGAG